MANPKQFLTGLKTNTINEYTPASGVTVDGMKIKDGGATIDTATLTLTKSGDATNTASLALTGVSSVSRTYTLPGSSSVTLVGDTATQTLTNKTISGSSNTITNIANSSLSQASSAMGVINVSTTGSKSITSLPFQPTFVEFLWGRTSSSAAYAMGYGVANGTIQRAYGGQVVDSASDQAGGTNSTTRCYIFASQTGALVADASFTSMNSDGFTINVLTANAALPEVIYKAYR